MEWEVEFTDEFGEWWEDLGEGEQEDISAVVGLLKRKDRFFPFHTVRILKVRNLGRCGNCVSSTKVNRTGFCMRLIQDELLCFLSVIGGCRTGDDRWYEKYVPVADKLYEEHLKTLPG